MQTHNMNMLQTGTEISTTSGSPGMDNIVLNTSQ